MIAVERHKNATPVNLYVKPQLALIFPYLQGDQIENGAIMSLRSKSFEQMFKSQSYERLVTLERSGPSPSPARHRMKSEKSLNQLFGHVTDTAKGLDDTENAEADDIDEIRLNYIEILRSCYYHQIENGSLEEYGDLTYSLFQGLDFCEHRGQPLNDWEATRMASDTRVVLANRIFVMTLRRLKQLWRRERKCCSGLDLYLDPVNFKIRFLVRQNLAFVRAHRHAQQIFQDRFLRVYGKLSPAESQIIQESQAQIRKAEADVNDIDQEDVLSVKGHLLSLILLNNSIQYVERLSRQKLIPEAQASELLQVLDGLVEDTWVCEELTHSGRLSTSTQIIRLQQLPTHIMEEFNIWEAIDEMNKVTSSPGGLRDSKMLFQGSTPPRMKMKRSPSSRSVFHSKWEIETAIQTVDTAPTESERTAPMDSERTNNSIVDDAPGDTQQFAALPTIPTLGNLMQRNETADDSSPPTF